MTNAVDSLYKKVIDSTMREIKVDHNHYWQIYIKGCPTLSTVEEWDNDKKLDFLLYCLNQKAQHKISDYAVNTPLYKRMRITHAYMHYLVNAKLIYTRHFLVQLAELQLHLNDAQIMETPWKDMINQLKKQFKKTAMSNEFVGILQHIQQIIQERVNGTYWTKDKVDILNKIDQLLDLEDGARPIYFQGHDSFTPYGNDVLKVLAKEKRTHWYKLMALAMSAKGGKPSKKFIETSKVHIKALGVAHFKKITQLWFSFLCQMEADAVTTTNTYNNQIYSYTHYVFLDAVNNATLKGFVWMQKDFHDKKTIAILGQLAERCYKKIPGIGPAAGAISNACFYALFSSKGMAGIGELSKLKQRIKQNNALKLIDQYLTTAAEQKNISIYEIEELAAPTFGMTNGEQQIEFGEYNAILKIVAAGKSVIQWIKPDGKQQKSIPAIVKKEYANQLKTLKATKKQLDISTIAQRDRIDNLFRANRQWSWNKFTTHYMEHGLVSFFAKQMIWTIKDDTSTQHIIWDDTNQSWVDVHGNTIHPKNNTIVSLWHPALVSTKEAKMWRDFLFEKERVQPIKQAFREVYLLTAAEVNTNTYSNRMAAHVLKQHQFNALAKARKWKYSLLGAYDDGISHQKASLYLPAYHMEAQFWVTEIVADDAFNDTGIWYYIATDQIRFIDCNTHEVVALADVPLLAFSEVFRDVDLFVGVASIGNDPNWQDSGGQIPQNDYWQSYSFGDLSTIATNRKEILERIVPRLKIREVAHIEGNFLIVKGKLRTYKIHIGSSNILMAPNDEYLCIVPDRTSKNATNNIFIPFEGDNTLSVIISKALLLAEDDKITDKTITSQIVWKK